MPKQENVSGPKAADILRAGSLRAKFDAGTMNRIPDLPITSQLIEAPAHCPIKMAISQLKTSVYQDVAEICGSVKSFEEETQPDG